MAMEVLQNQKTIIVKEQMDIPIVLILLQPKRWQIGYKHTLIWVQL